jgi:hypothetical protein
MLRQDGARNRELSASSVLLAIFEPLLVHEEAQEYVEVQSVRRLGEAATSAFLGLYKDMMLFWVGGYVSLGCLIY